MSRAFYYKCDGCDKPTGDKPHIVLCVGHDAHSGIALPPKSKWSSNTEWRVRQNIVRGVYHFHNPACVAKWFGLRLIEATDKKA